MPKRTYKTDSDNLRKRVKSGKVDKSQLKGDALKYYNRYQGHLKAKATRAGKIAKVEHLVIPKDSEAYKIIAHAAELKGISVAEFTAKYHKAVKALLDDGATIIDRETDRLIRDILRSGKGAGMYINDGDGFTRVGKNQAMVRLQEFQTYVFGVSDIFLLLFRTEYKFTGDYYFYLPNEPDYMQYEGEELEEYLDEWYPNIKYVKSAKKD